MSGYGWMPASVAALRRCDACSHTITKIKGLSHFAVEIVGYSSYFGFWKTVKFSYRGQVFIVAAAAVPQVADFIN